MTSAGNAPSSDEERSDANSLPNGPGGGGDDALEGGSGIGPTTSDEPDTFEPEESPE